MNASHILEYYFREDVKQALLEMAKGREVAGVFRGGAFGKRPGTLAYPEDISSQVRSGVVEFHYSLERWSNPALLQTQERVGFDLVFDLDCKVFEHGRTAAVVLAKVLKKHGVTPSVKFSGNLGFHVGIPWESIPKEIGIKQTSQMFPDVARQVGLYVRDFMREPLEKALLKTSTPEKLANQAGIPLEKVTNREGIDPFQLADIDPILISPRHLLRMAYSLNKKAFLVSLPLCPGEVEEFERKQASPEKVKVTTKFLDSGKEGEADMLFAEGLDWFTRLQKKEKKLGKRREPLKAKVPEAMFPPCIKNIRAGLKDGRKRSMFILIKFLHSMKWGWDEIESFMVEWNKKNTPPLREQQLMTQIRYYSNKEKVPPPNCSQGRWYTDFFVCTPDRVCVSRENIKNPVNYPFRVMKANNRGKPRKRGFKS